MSVMNIIAALAKVEAAVEIESPAPMKVQRSYPFRANGRDAIDLPCFMHNWRLITDTPRPNGFVETKYDIRVQLFVAPSDTDEPLVDECATELHEAFLRSYRSNLQLDGNVSLVKLRGADGVYLPGTLSRGGIEYVGIEYFIEATINEVANVGP